MLDRTVRYVWSGEGQVAYSVFGSGPVQLLLIDDGLARGISKPSGIIPTRRPSTNGGPHMPELSCGTGAVSGCRIRCRWTS